MTVMIKLPVYWDSLFPRIVEAAKKLKDKRLENEEKAEDLK